ncbi:DUF6250 domain-containing protein [Sphingobacterium sp. LRF_L2]|uniref:DUF6250 domain-containing protein n=1 Tax=Sphingobacterium sp. LRF_L2 TaxID=3369421 RepID=UPI003F600CBE
MTSKFYSTQLLLLLGVFTIRQATAQQQDSSLIALADPAHWRVEFEYPQQSKLELTDSVISIASFGGATLWLDSLLQEDYVIEYERMVVLDGEPYDRLSDFNQFWLAHEPTAHHELKSRDGKLASYDSLDLFYVGMGGNYNSTTRFRKYDGKGERLLLAEKNETPYLLQPNVYYQIKTVVAPKKGYTAFYVNNKLLFKYKGTIGKEGFFGFRQTASRQKIKALRIYPLSSSK